MRSESGPTVVSMKEGNARYVVHDQVSACLPIMRTSKLCALDIPTYRTDFIHSSPDSSTSTIITTGLSRPLKA